jgi:hypothetical protein
MTGKALARCRSISHPDQTRPLHLHSPNAALNPVKAGNPRASHADLSARTHRRRTQLLVAVSISIDGRNRHKGCSPFAVGFFLAASCSFRPAATHPGGSEENKTKAAIHGPLHRIAGTSSDGAILRPSPPPYAALLVVVASSSPRSLPEQSSCLYSASTMCRMLRPPVSIGLKEPSIQHENCKRSARFRSHSATSPPYKRWHYLQHCLSFRQEHILVLAQPVLDADLVVDAHGFLDPPNRDCRSRQACGSIGRFAGQPKQARHPPAAGGGECSAP